MRGSGVYERCLLPNFGWHTSWVLRLFCSVIVSIYDTNCEPVGTIFKPDVVSDFFTITHGPVVRSSPGMLCQRVSRIYEVLSGTRR